MASIDDTIAGAVEECLQLLKMGGVVDPHEGLHTAPSERGNKSKYIRGKWCWSVQPCSCRVTFVPPPVTPARI